MKIKTIIKRPGKDPYMLQTYNSFKMLQQTVGGYIKTVTLASDLVIICNEEGRILNLPYNCSICGMDFYGTIIFTGIAGDDFADIPRNLTWLKRMFPTLWEE